MKFHHEGTDLTGKNKLSSLFYNKLDIFTTFTGMKISGIIREKVNRLPRGYTFTYTDLSTTVESREAVIKALNRMVGAGKLIKLSKGRYYKPEASPFGNLKPSEAQVVKDLLERNGQVIGYLTGNSIYNQLGLTTQVTNTIQIGSNTFRPSFKRGKFQVSYIRQKNRITQGNIPYLQLLDAIRYLKKIPGTGLAEGCVRMLAILKPMKKEELSILVRLAGAYSPATRALLGAMLEKLGKSIWLDSLYKSLNPITYYNWPGAKEILPAAEKWNIK
ncbi:MAG: DUF6088 family protein [Chitinophagaceae bacterium]|nr:DUF6088 family protein [Chitinophagaceae bacterium]